MLNTQKNNERVVAVDAIRGFSVILMIIYHFFFDLNYFGISYIALSNIEWVLFQRIIAVLFIGIAGISLALSYEKYPGYGKHAKRGLKLAAIAGIITLATWVYPHEGFILFGIIHFIALSTFISPFFIGLKNWNIIIAFLVIASGASVADIVIEHSYLIWLGIMPEMYYSLDHYPILPWFGVILIGLLIGQRIRKRKTRMDENLFVKKMAGIGRHSLIIYLVHQPVLVLLLHTQLLLELIN